MRRQGTYNGTRGNVPEGISVFPPYVLLLVNGLNGYDDNVVLSDLDRILVLPIPAEKGFPR